MKKLLTFVLIFIMYLCHIVYAEQINMSMLNDDNLNEQLKPIINLYNEAAKTNDLEQFYKITVKGYKYKKTGNIEKIKQYNDVFAAAAIQFSAQKYDISKERKYLLRAYKWSKIAVKDRTTQIFAIKSDIILASMFLEPKEMVKAYELYRAVDLNSAEMFKDKFSNIYDATKEYIAQRNEKKRLAWAGALKIMGFALQTAGNTITQYERERNGYNNYYYVNYSNY